MSAAHDSFEPLSEAALRAAPRLSSSDPPGPGAAARLLRGWGFLANPDLPDGPGPGLLLVALRSQPSRRHYDPELVEYWISRGNRGTRAALSRRTAMPLEREFAWGRIRLRDRLGVTNEWVTFGGRLAADRVDDETIAVFASPAPLLRRGGHSQGWDLGADAVGAFFGRLMIAVDFVAGFEAALAAASPAARYAAFVADFGQHYGRGSAATTSDQRFAALVTHEAARLRQEQPAEWAAGRALLGAAGRSGDR